MSPLSYIIYVQIVIFLNKKRCTCNIYKIKLMNL